MSLLALGVVVLLAGCGSSGQEAKPSVALTGPPIKIGMDLDKTGPGSSYNPLAGAAVTAAVADINEHGGILGRPVVLVESSSESDPARGPAVYQSLIESGVSGILGLSTASVVVQVKPVLQKAGVVTIAPIAVLPTLTSQPNGDFVYSLVNPVTDFGDIFCAAFAATNVKRVAYFGDDSPAIKSLADVLKKRFAECAQIVVQVTAPLASTDLSAQAAKIKDSKPDAIFVQSVGGPFEALAHSAFAQVMPNVPRFSQGAFGNQPDAWPLAAAGSLRARRTLKPCWRSDWAPNGR
jgi:branched-chain amino acid transport system substrate-binding protein